MRLNFTALTNKLKQTIDQIYIISGDDNFLLQEHYDLIKTHLRQNNVTSHLRFTVDNKFNWNDFFLELNNFSLFANRTLLELKFADKLNTNTITALTELATQNINNDKILLFIMPKLDTDTMNQSWFIALNKIGNFIPVFNITNAQFPFWVKERLQNENIKITQDALIFFTDILDGNLYAAKQEIEKLKLMSLTSPVTLDMLRNIIFTNNAKFDIYNLVDTALSGNKIKILQILETLQQNNTEIILILWALVRQIRTLINIKEEITDAKTITSILTKNGIWESKQKIVLNCVQRHSMQSLINLLTLAYKIDCANKGAENINPWNAITSFTLKLARV